MEQKKAYRFYNIDQGKFGEIWAEHKSCAEKGGGITPPNCIKEEIGENSQLPCNFCGK